jgi:hypothetical protein
MPTKNSYAKLSAVDLVDDFKTAFAVYPCLSYRIDLTNPLDDGFPIATIGGFTYSNPTNPSKKSKILVRFLPKA